MQGYPRKKQKNNPNPNPKSKQLNLYNGVIHKNELKLNHATVKETLISEHINWHC